MVEDLATTVARLDRIMRGENGVWKGLSSRVPELERSVERIEDSIEELKRIERTRVKQEEVLARRQQKQEEDRKKWLMALAPPLVILAVGQVVSFVTDVLLTFGPPPVP